MQTAIDIFSQWCDQWQLTINAAKTQAILFILPRQLTRERQNPDNLNLYVHKTLIRPTHEVKYLGLTYEYHLTWNPHMKALTKKH